MFARMFTAVAVVVAMAAPISKAEAHPKLLSSTPAVNAHVGTAPTSLSLTFNENLTLALSSLTLMSADQKKVALDSLHSGTDGTKTLTARIKDTLAPGTYTVKWQAAGGDGHPVKGEFTFMVGAHD